ncbi:uncharacterized protein BDR25DRAFT_251761 [Lindgomyces ingoldianus]|uniref:Uncharacterized protein n=1 Tax=Lindgomyces ingoldianus TaxID=673940 RepID=A0ACB6RFS5_9PLEO|nr:uncharacterized protein BDR25DRAFT_251761 [Lindgomyces ingoldianus]KAF2477172.1 hypothetical protein BDR25DRAFT_251761 [Lindgomyces ingoldianus]
MVAIAPYAASVATISSAAYYTASSYLPVPQNYTTAVIVKTLTICPCNIDGQCATGTSVHVNSYSTSAPKEHGGPYDNPYNDIPLPYYWPGKPSSGEVTPPPQPTEPYSYGGPAKGKYDAPAWIPKGYGKLKGSLPEGKQNGKSYWGDIDCPHLPVSGLPGAPSYPPLPPPSSYPTSVKSYPTAPYPTGSGSVSYSTNSTKVTASTSYSSKSTSTPAPACPTMPDTGVTRTYDFNVAYQTIAPDGVTRNALTVNGQFPGPLVEANWGDWILLRVTNDLTNEGTALHAHGLFQQATPWYDGVPAVAQCPLTPNGGKLDMLFRADRYGTSWYHSHYSAQYSGGAQGPMIIHGPKHAEYDIDIGPVLLTDWYHADYYTLVQNTMAGNFPPSNNNLINGKMQYPCANTTLPCNPNAGISKFRFQSGKKHLLRLINTGAEGTQKFSIDNHTLTVVAQDFIPIEPYTTNVVTLGIAQRADVIVEATGDAGDAFWMRSQLGTERCTLNDGISPNAVAAVYYEDTDEESVPETTSDVTAAQLAFCANDPLNQTVPLCKIPLDEPTTTEQIDIEVRSNGTNFIWYMNNSSYRGDYNNPILIQAKNGDLDYQPQWNVHNFGTNKTVRLHLINHGRLGAHPMHLHGHDYHVLAEGFGDWDGTIVNPENTVRRDTHILQNARSATVPAFMVLQYNQDNPGVWPLHCHLAWHVSGGLFMNALERPEDIQAEDFDQDIFDGCTAWDAYTAGNPPNQIDSGL